MAILRPFVRTFGGMRHTVRDIARLRQVAQVLMRHGFGMLVTRLDIPGLHARLLSSNELESTPEHASQALQELGPTFIKLGQVLSTRSDVLPPAYIEAFQQLQDDVDQLPFSDIEGVLSRQLGDGWRERVRTFDERPLATASIAQVHRATLEDGREVVFKVQRPGIGRKIRADLNILKLLAAAAVNEFPELADLGARAMIDEFERSITAELDFIEEAKNMARMAANFAGNEFVVIPASVEAFTTRTVLCIDFLDGVRIRDARAAGMNMDIVGARYLETAYTMLFEHAFFHGDLHPGNVLVLPGERLGLLDFGMVGRLTGEMKDHMVSLFFALQRGDHRNIARIVFDIAIKEHRVDFPAFERDCTEVVEQHWSGTNIQEMEIGAFLVALSRGAMRHRVRIPDTYTMYFKAILTTEGLAKSLIPEVDPLAAAMPYVRKLIEQQYAPERLKDEVVYNLLTLNTLARRLPISLTQALDDLDKQRLHLNISVKQDKTISDAKDRRQNRMIIALFSITGVLCGSATLPSENTWIYGVPVLSLVFFATSLPLFLLTMWMTLRNRG